MYLTCKKNHGIDYLYMMDSVRINGKVHKEIVENYGPFETAPEEIKQAYLDKKKGKKLAAARAEQAKKAKVQSLVKAIEACEKQQEKPFLNRGLALRYGHLALKPLWEQELGLKYKIDYLQKEKTKIEKWRLTDLLFYLCTLKLLSPSSYLGAYESKSQFFYCPWNEVVQDNFYRCLDFVYQYGQSIIKHGVKSHHKKQKTEIKVAFFDCTNTWFETPYDDLTWQTIRFERDKKAELLKQGFDQASIERYLMSESYDKELSEHLEIEAGEILRMRGKSKEGRYAQPIVTVALAIDQSGFPIDCEVFAGNLSEIHTVEPMIESLKRKYDVKDIYFVADKALNSAEKLDFIQTRDLGFVVAQKVSQQTKPIRAEMLSLTGYKNCRFNEDGSVSVALDDAPLNEEGYRFKVCPHTKKYEAKVPSEDNQSKTTKKSIKCSILYCFSPKRKAKDLAELEFQISKANRAIQDKKLLGNPCGSGWRALVTTKKEQCENKELCKNKF